MNYSFHLFEDKLKSLIKAFSVLRKNAVLVIGDSFNPRSLDFKDDPLNWFYSAGGAISVDACLDLATRSGFRESQFIPENNPDFADRGTIGYMILKK